MCSCGPGIHSILSLWTTSEDCRLFCVAAKKVDISSATRSDYCNIHSLGTEADTDKLNSISSDLFVLLMVVEIHLALVEYGVVDFHHGDVVSTASTVSHVGEFRIDMS